MGTNNAHSAKYSFESERLGFRNWSMEDLDLFFTKINNDDQVMEFFPFKPSKQDTQAFIERMQNMFTEKGFCYFAVDILETNEFIGFIGLCEQTYLEQLGSFVDIGWRLKTSAWGKGYATEGAKACLRYGFEALQLPEIYAVASEINIKSIAVMQKIGMEQVSVFNHPKLTKTPELESCVLYKIKNK